MIRLSTLRRTLRLPAPRTCRALATAALGIAPVAAALVVAAPSAQAATTAPRTLSSQATAFCTDPNLGGEFRCAGADEPTTGEAIWLFPNNTQEIFVIGTDNAVWTIWDNTSGGWSGWVSLHGQVYAGEFAAGFGASGAQTGGGTWAVDLVVVGTNGKSYHDQRGNSPSGTWGGWKLGD